MNLKDEDLFDINLSKIQLFDLLTTVVDDTIEMKKKNKQLQTRIEKAVEYVEEAKEQDFMWTPIFMKELLNILKGEEK